MPMKVTVCFDKTKVLVPCGDGELLVRELIEKAITRYKKAIGKSTDYWVSVHTLRTVSEDSILDPDDTLCDVVDDREQLIADYEEQGGPRVHHNGGDGQSVSSTGTASPDIFQADPPTNKNHHRGYSFDSGNDVIVTATDISSGSGLTVRRGSEPALNVIDDKPLTNGNADLSHDEHDSGQQENITPSQHEPHKPIIKSSGAPKEKEKTPPFSRFARDSWRQSLGNHPSMFKWLEAQERQEDRYKEQTERQGPVGGATSPKQQGESTDKPPKPPIPPQTKPKEVGILICLPNDGTPLGIHVVPDFSEDGRETGLLVQGIEQGGRIFRDGRLKVQDRIIEINSQDLHDVTFAKAQDIFRNAMKTEEVQLKVVKHSIPPLPKKPPPAVLPKPRGHSPVKPSPLTLPPQFLDINSPHSSPDQTSTPLDPPDLSKPSPTEAASKPQSSTATKKNLVTSSPIKPASPTKRPPPPAPPTRHPSTTLSSNSVEDNKDENGKEEDKGLPTSTPTGTLTKNRENIIAPTNTKKIGKRVEIDLVKGPMGLGFSITTRDNATGGPSPIYIKNILPKGAAVMDGRLKAGDRLLEVNDEEMTGKTQSEAVSILRNMALGTKVNIVVSRQEAEEDERFKVPRELPLEKSGDDGTLAVMKNKELLEFNIPLNDTGSAGLGVSVKGKTLTTEEGTRDLGIFVKAVIHGGAASKDGRLQVNDQLLEVNSVALVNQPNTEAMDLLRRAMQEEEPIPGCINIKVARRIGAPSPTPFTVSENEFKDKSFEENNNIDKNDHVTNSNSDYMDMDTPARIKNGDSMSNFKSPNVFLDRIMAGNGLRNVSYTRATHDSYMETPEPKRNIMDLPKQRPRPHSTLGIERGSPTNSSDSDDGNKEPAWLHGPDWTRHASQTSEESEVQSPGIGDGFSRDGFGRQSMSEKRKGHGDPRSSEIYQKVKGLKELNKAGIRGPAPPSNLKRFNSLENLTTMHDADADMSGSFDDDDVNQLPRMARKRGGNESFRAAVDRSYDPVPHHNDMDPQNNDEALISGMRRSRSVEEESSEGGSLGRDPLNSARSSVSDHPVTDDPKKKGGAKKTKENRKSGGLLKGFLKFTKGRKTPVEEVNKGVNSQPPEEKGDFGEGPNHADHQQQMWLRAQEDQERAREQHRRLQEQHLQDQRQHPANQQAHAFNPYPYSPPESHNMGHSAPIISNRDEPMSRAEKIQQLRADHQRRHMERHGHYPQEEREEEYERIIQEQERKASRFNGDDYFLQKYGQSAIPSQLEAQGQWPRPASRNQQERPNSRLGQGDMGQGTSNYQDYSEINKLGTRHTSDSNVIKYSYQRPPSRGHMDQNFYQSNPQGHARGPTPTLQDRPYQHHAGVPRGPTPSHEHEGFVKYNSTGNTNSSNYQTVHRGPTPTNQNLYYAEELNVRKSNYVNPANYTNRDHVPRQEVLPPGGGMGHYGNATMAYRDPVFTAMAGKRPVKSLSSQPNSAKV